MEDGVPLEKKEQELQLHPAEVECINQLTYLIFCKQSITIIDEGLMNDYAPIYR